MVWSIGLEWNHQKCELLVMILARLGRCCALHGLRVVNPDVATLFGSPIGGLVDDECAIASKSSSLKLIGDRYFDAHDPLCIFRHAFT